jgi:hypothetical protein
MRSKLWFATASAALALCEWLVSSDATKSGNDLHYSFWFSALAIGAYMTAAIFLISLALGLISLKRRRLRKQVRVKLPDPLAVAQGSYVLGEYYLRRIKKVSAATEHTRVQKEWLLAPYRGMRIQFTGTVVDVRPSSRVTLRTCVRNFTALLGFSDTARFGPQLSILQPKQHITVIGEIEQIEENSISLVKCESSL